VLAVEFLFKKSDDFSNLDPDPELDPGQDFHSILNVEPAI
jgi:hypothetical protein